MLSIIETRDVFDDEVVEDIENTDVAEVGYLDGGFAAIEEAASRPPEATREELILAWVAEEAALAEAAEKARLPFAVRSIDLPGAVWVRHCTRLAARAEARKARRAEAAKAKAIEARKARRAEAAKAKAIEARKARRAEAAKAKAIEARKARRAEAAKAKAIEARKARRAEAVRPQGWGLVRHLRKEGWRQVAVSARDGHKVAVLVRKGARRIVPVGPQA